jgi:hypothetical protein
MPERFAIGHTCAMSTASPEGTKPALARAMPIGP